MGTEISTTATEYDNTGQWDFHEIKKEWRGAVDFIYTNSLDHAYDPQKAVRTWIQCLNENGLCFIEWWGVVHPEPVPNDPFSATYDGFTRLLQEWGSQDNYRTQDVLPLELSKRKGPARGRQGGVFVLERIKTL